MENEEVHQVREATYRRKLEENIALKQGFLEVGSKKSTQFEPEGEEDELTSLKRETIALYESLKNVPFKTQRDDLIGIALADSMVQTQVDDLTELNSSIKATIETTQKRGKYLSALVFNLNLLNNLLISKERELTGKTKETEIIDEERVEKVLEKLNRREYRLIEHTKEILLNYLITDTDRTRQDKTKVLSMMEDLLNLLSLASDEYLETPAELVNDPVLRQLLLGNVIQQKDNFRHIKLHKFGL